MEIQFKVKSNSEIKGGSNNVLNIPTWMTCFCIEMFIYNFICFSFTTYDFFDMYLLIFI